MYTDTVWALVWRATRLKSSISLCTSRAVSRKQPYANDSKVVARDGIEPPTPAFSGPRSTTELSGLGIGTPVIGDRQEPPCATIYFLLSVAPALSGEPVADGNQQRKRILSIAISSHTAKWPASRYPFSSCTGKDAHAPSHQDLSCRTSSLPAYRCVYPHLRPVINEGNSPIRKQEHCPCSSPNP